MNHAEHRAVRERLLRERPRLLDLAELDLYRSVGSRLAAIGASTGPASRHRCHVAERYLDYLKLPADAVGAAHVTHGIRRALGALFAMLAERRVTIAVPDDVYPVYLRLASEAGVSVETYSARRGLPPEDGGHAALLVCAPLKPWGTTNDLDAARRWARADRERMLLLDMAYAVPARGQVVLDDDAIVMTSLSKGWLLPDHVGVCLTPPRFQAPVRRALAALAVDEDKLRVGFSALTTHAERPDVVAQHLVDRARWLDGITRSRPELKAGLCRGYFAVSDRPFEALLGAGVLAIPATVFGGPPSHSVLSSLEPVPPR